MEGWGDTHSQLQALPLPGLHLQKTLLLWGTPHLCVAHPHPREPQRAVSPTPMGSVSLVWVD